MRINGSPTGLSKLTGSLLLLLLCGATASAQPDSHRQTVAITYPLDQSVSVKFRGTTRLPALNQLDMSFRKVFRSGGKVFSHQPLTTYHLLSVSSPISRSDRSLTFHSRLPRNAALRRAPSTPPRAGRRGCASSGSTR